MAAQSLLRPCLTATSPLPLRLRNFLTEYYVYTATLSMISIDPRVSPQLFLTDEPRDLANELVATGYIGNMCGCWLELILLIPSIFDLCRQLTPVDDQQLTPPTADHFVTFAQLHSSILNWTPGLPLDQEVFLAGRAFQQAMLLYLHTALGAFSKQQDGPQSASIQSAITEALSVLAQLDSTSRINTSLCWPIAVVGSCLTDVGQKAFLTGRLEQMFTSIGLGNIRQTSNLLERMWATSVTGDGPEAGPWSICRVMHENQIWISFA